MTADERFFHLIGFIDAVVYLERAGIIFRDHKYSRNSIPMAEDTPEYDVLHRILSIVESRVDE